MAISIRGNATGWVAVNATTQTVTLPTHQAGDMLIVRAGCKPFGATITCGTAGWEPVADQFTSGSVANGNGTGSLALRAFWKIAASASETSPVIDWGTTAAPGAASAVCYQKGAGENWVTPVGAGGTDESADTSLSATISSHISTTAGDMVDFYSMMRDDCTMTVPTFTQAGLTLAAVAEQPAAALDSTTSNDIAADGGYRLVSSGTSSAAAVVTGTTDTNETGAAWTTRLRVAAPVTHATSGALTGGASVIAGTAARARFTPVVNAFRFYEDGTEDGSTPLAAQDVSLGDLASLYEETTNNSQDVFSPESGGVESWGEAIVGDGRAVKQARWTLETFDSPTGTLFAEIFACTGTPGTDAVPTGAALATSDSIDASSITGTPTEFTFTFATPFTLANGSPYAVVLRWADFDSAQIIVYEFQGSRPASNLVRLLGGEWNADQPGFHLFGRIEVVGFDVSADTQVHLRYRIQETGGIAGASTDDYALQYRKNGGTWTAVTASSSNVKADTASGLTADAATTNRATNGITDGTGSFVAGEQEETNGVIEDHQLTASNFTEHVWALVLIAADLANADLLEFRVTLNGGDPGISNTVTPSITVSQAAGPVTHDTSGALAGAGAALDGAASSATTRPSSGVLTGGAAALSGSATRTRVHSSSGVLETAGAEIVGAAARTRVHATDGVLAGSGAELTGDAMREGAAVEHTTSGILTTSGAEIAGSAAREGGTVEHVTSGDLVGQSSIVAGLAARTRLHAVSGVLLGQGSTLSGEASRTRIFQTEGMLVGQGALITGSAAREGDDPPPAPGGVSLLNITLLPVCGRLMNR